MVSRPFISQMDFPINVGERDSFDLVFRTYHQPLIYYASKFVDVDDAGDLVENLFVKLWQKSPELASEAHLRNYLYLALRSHCLDYQKSRMREASRHQKVMAETDLTEQSHLEQLMSAEVLAEVYRAIHNLPLQCSRVITLTFLEGKSNAEAAEELGLSEQTVKNHKVRGLKILKGNLSGEAFTILTVLYFIH